jgi:AraC-like DNA-binding protein
MKKFFTHADPVVPVHHPRVLVETAVAQGADRGALLENVGVTLETLESPEARISYVQFATLVHNALALTGNPALGLDFGRNIHLSHMGVLGLAVMSSPNARAAFEVGLRHYRSLAPAWDLELRVDEGRGRFIAREAIPLRPFVEFATEALLAAIVAMARSLLHRDLPIWRLNLSYPKPAYAERYAEMVSAPIFYDQPVTVSEFDPAILELPVQGADPATDRIAEQIAATSVGPSVSVEGLVAQVRRVLGSVSGRPPDVDEVARTLQTSSRSLRRSLQRMGTSYQELLDEARRARAEEWVRATDLTMDQVASQLGFGDVRSFRRAFKRWTGVTPNAFRDGAGKRAS